MIVVDIDSGLKGVFLRDFRVGKSELEGNIQITSTDKMTDIHGCLVPCLPDFSPSLPAATTTRPRKALTRATL